MRDIDTRNRVIEKAIRFGACLVGVTDVELLRKSPSHMIYGKLDEYRGVGTKPSNKMGPGEFAWPENARSAIILAIEHSEKKPELDWWQEDLKGRTLGNSLLIAINEKLTKWLKETMGIEATGLSYYIERGGVFLKDAAALAGLGCIGKNNMLVTPDFGPRVRLRAIFTNERLPQTDTIDFDPCIECHKPCRDACPRSAFKNNIFSDNPIGIEPLPARSGVYSRNLCNIEMEWNIRTCDKIEVGGAAGLTNLVKYCRKCETSCPVGKPNSNGSRDKTNTL